MLPSKFKHYSDFIASVLSKINTLCKPNPKYTPLQAEQETNQKRNKIVFYFHIGFFCLLWLDFFIQGTPFMDTFLRCFLPIVISSSVILSCKYHPAIYQIPYTMCSASFGLTALTEEKSIFTALAVAPLVPVANFLCIGSIWHALFQGILQVIYLNTIYYDEMIKSFGKLSAKESAAAFRDALSLAFIIYGLVFSLTNYFMKEAYIKVSNIEKKKLEVENQKTFLLSFSHELRNLINSLVGNVKLASLENSLTDQTKELLRTSEVCGELLLHLVNNILDTGKVEIGELEINPKPSKIHETFEKIWGICSELIKQRELYGSMKIAKNVPKALLFDHYRLTQVFLNLVTNATKYTEKGSIKINVQWIDNHEEVNERCFKPYPFSQETDDQDEGIFEKEQSFMSFNQNYLTLTAQNKLISNDSLNPLQSECNKGILKITITDTGCGMNKQQMVQLFQKFTQVNTDPSRRMLGTGLGLFISKQICEAMNGEVRVYSKVNAGSCFTFCLPMDKVKDKTERYVDSVMLKNTIKAKHLKVMIVDDIAFNHTILAHFFEMLGVQVVDIAVNGLEAYEKYVHRCENGSQPDIITMDIEMPVMNGKESSSRIREFEKLKGLTPCFLTMVSGNCTESEIKDCLNKYGQVRADDFLKKPVSLNELLRTLSHHFIQE